MKALTPVLLVSVVIGLGWSANAGAQIPSELEPGRDTSQVEESATDPIEPEGRLAAAGLTLRFDATYVFQSVASGGFSGPSFSSFSNETSNGHTFSGDLRGEFDTAQAGWWQGGKISTRLQTRAGRSIVQRAGSIAAVNNEALFPNVVDKFDDEVWAITELAYEHTVSETVSIYAGLLNTSLGDENAIAGSAQSHSHFLNFALLYSAVEDATTGNAALGGGVDWIPTERLSASFSVYGSQETAGENPFRTWHGTTLSTEWTLSHELAGRSGAQTFGFLYGINVVQANLASDPRLVIVSIVLGLPLPTNTSNTWAFYYNAHQFIEGDETGGWGVFARWGVSDGNPNLVKQNAALGVGGVGLFPTRELDRWGCGAFVVDMSNAPLLQGLRITDEVGGEAYYQVTFSPSFHVTLDAQVIDSGLPRADTVCVLGLRANYSF